MQTDEFEWDDGKAAKNAAKHGVTFEEVTFAFDDPDGFEDTDNTEPYDEDRFIWVGWSGQALLMVVYTERGHRKRIISAREADQHEEARYHRRR